MKALTYCCIFFLVLQSGITIAQEPAKVDSSKKEKALQEVSVIAQKSAIETAPGKTIVNVQAMAGNGGKNVLELLRKLPGVSVDGQGNISMTGKQGVLVTVNGRETFLSGDDLRNYLQGMTAEEVNQIELITQPSAHYDAEGNAGIINIKMKKIRKAGFNGSATTSYTLSKLYGSNNTLLLNYNKNKVNVYSSINYLNASNTVTWDNDLRFLDASSKQTATSLMHAVPVEVFEKWNLRTGADYNYSANTTMGIGLTGAYYGNTMHSDIHTVNNDGSPSPLLMNRYTTEKSLRRNGGCNVYLKHSFSKQSELTVNLDYLMMTRLMDQFLTTDAEQNSSNLPNQLVLRSKLPINIQVWSAKADHVYTLKNGTKVESGGKISYVNVDNSGVYDIFENGSWKYDSSRTNHFLYDERIAALYVNALKKLGTSGKWETQLGLRAETAQLHGRQETTGEEFSRELPALFPTAYLNYKPNSNNSFELNYGRRVERPKYNMLNPFNYYTFYNTYQKGNPNLLPQYSQNVELKHVYKNVLTTGFELSTVNDNINDVVMVADSKTQTTYGQPVNFGSTNMANLSVTYMAKPRPWWDLMVAVQGWYCDYTGKYDNRQVSAAGLGAAAWASNQFTFGKWLGECWLNYNSGTVSSPVAKNKQNLYMNFGVSRKWLHDTLVVRMSVDDPLYIYRNITESNQPGLYNTSTMQSNSRYATLAVTYNFGKNTERNARQNNSTPDEAKRM